MGDSREPGSAGGIVGRFSGRQSVIASIQQGVRDWGHAWLGLSTGRVRPSLAWSGAVIIVVTLVVGVLAVRSGTGPEGNASSSDLEWGMSSLVLMSWSFVLATRLGFVERLFGGLDGVCRAHRWVGVCAVVSMLLHKQDPSVAWGFMPFSYTVSHTATEAVEKAFVLALVLVGLSLVRLVPYGWWRWSHKLFALVFGLSVWHVVTTPRPFGPVSWAQFFVYGVIVVGAVALMYRLVWLDVARRGRRYRVRHVVAADRWVDMTLEPCGRPLAMKAGQSVVLKVQRRGLREPHFFTVASGPRGDGAMRFVIREAGDWTSRLRQVALSDEGLDDVEVLIEGPFGRFDMTGGRSRVVWVAGGVGVTPFLACSEELMSSQVNDVPSAGADDRLVSADSLNDDSSPRGGVANLARPTLVWCVRSLEDAPGLDVVQAAVDAGVLDVTFVVSGDGERLDVARLAEVLDAVSGGQSGLVHVAVCGPPGLVADVSHAARAAGVGSVSSEGFDLRGAVGPSLSTLRRG